jgi:hypothetical protein
MVMTMLHDQMDRPFLYVANKEAGLTIYNISTITSPALVTSVPTTQFDTLEVMSLSQYGNYLYLALGNSFTNAQRGGMAIVDVTNPEVPFVTDYYILPGSESGGGIVKVENNYAYLGAMMSGLVILDVTNKNNIQFVKQFIPDIHYPPVFNPIPTYYNARGMEVRNSIIYLCYDAGGLRIIDCTDKLNPVETGRYANPASYIPINLPRAYNNIILDDSLAYITVDYCGMEVLNISDTNNIRLVGWWNPYDCPGNQWGNSPVHANEMYYDKTCNHIFLATGKSDMHVLDVSDPSSPDSCNFYGGVSNDMGTWGISVYKNEIYLSYICNFLPFPFPSNWTGVKILSYSPCTTGIDEVSEQIMNFELNQNYPNPFNSTTNFEFRISSASGGGFVSLKVFDVLGNEVATLVNEEKPIGKYEVTWNANNVASGVYLYRLQAGIFTAAKRLVLIK